MLIVQDMDRECCRDQAQVEQDGRSCIGGETSGGVEHPAEERHQRDQHDVGEGDAREVGRQS